MARVFLVVKMRAKNMSIRFINFIYISYIFIIGNIVEAASTYCVCLCVYVGGRELQNKWSGLMAEVVIKKEK